jgi:exodeoxyribonuclease-3
MKLVSWNVNGIRSVLNKGFIEKVMQINPDIIGLQEIKARPEQVGDALESLNYQIIWNPAVRPGYSGTAVLTKLQPTNYILGMGILDQKLVDKFGDVASEGRVITLEFDNFYFVNVYTPNSKPDLSRLEFRHKIWDTAFLQFLLDLEKHKPVIFSGDLNVAHKEIDLARPKENRKNAGFTDEERQGFDNIVENGFLDTFRLFNNEGGNYTWWSNFGGARAKNIGWRIDYVCISNTLRDTAVSAKIHAHIMGSDHCPVELILKI